jgi:hypothetical protein
MIHGLYLRLGFKIYHVLLLTRTFKFIYNPLNISRRDRYNDIFFLLAKFGVTENDNDFVYCIDILIIGSLHILGCNMTIEMLRDKHLTQKILNIELI